MKQGLEKLVMKEDVDYLAQLGELQSKSYLTLAQNLTDAVKKRAKHQPEGLDLPLGGTSILRFVPGRWTVWAGPTHHGKTQFLRFVMTHGMKKGYRVLFASLEDDPEDIVYEFCAMALGTRRLDDQRIDAAMEWFEDRLTIFNHTGFIDPNVMLGAIIYAAKEYGVKHAVIDSLMMMSIRKDDYEGQKEFGMQLNRVTKQYDIHVHLIVHPRKTANSDELMDLNDIQGASELASLSHVAVTLQRMPRVEKNRAAWGLMEKTDLGTKAHSVLRVWKQRGDWNRTGTVEMAYLPGPRQWSLHAEAGPRRFLGAGTYRELGIGMKPNPYDDPFDFDPPQQDAF
jgi:KaiC/GvpD/RAD55 family RecA-like ATPase